jgi:hypothetical protein
LKEKIAEMLKLGTNIDLTLQPYVIESKKNAGDVCRVRLETHSKKQMQKMAKFFRYFTFHGRQCYGLTQHAKQEEDDLKKIYVKGLPNDQNWNLLHDEFSHFGDINSLRVLLDKDHNPTNTALIYFCSKAAVKLACMHSANVTTFYTKDAFDYRRSLQITGIKHGKK